jgi:uncharacterized coiled-coil DUF342 family protein
MTAIRCALLAAALAAPSITAAQSPATSPPDVLKELLVEVRGLRAAMERAATVGARIQLLVARVQMQEQRIAEASRRANEIRDDLSGIDMQIAQVSAMVKQFERGTVNVSPEEQSQVESMLEMQKQQVAAAEKRRQDLLNEESLLAQQIAADQSRWSDVNNQLDELERSLTPRKQ